MTVDEKIFVGEAPDPPLGKWREVTRVLPSADDCIPWAEFINSVGKSDTRIKRKADGFVLEAMRMRG